MKKRLVRVLVVVMMMVGMCVNAYAADNVMETHELSDEEIVTKYIKLGSDYRDKEFDSVELMESTLGEGYIDYILYDEGYPTLAGSVSREYAIYVIERND